MKKRLLVITAIALIVASAVYILVMLENTGVFSLSRALKVKYPLSFYTGEHGTADRLEGKTLCVSLFVDLDKHEWNDVDEDNAKIQQCYDNLGMATDWIAEQAAGYGKSVEFIYDWKQYPELYYEVSSVGDTFGFWLCENDGYNLLWDYVNNNVPSAQLKEDFGADNIIYITYYDNVSENSTSAFSKDCYFDPQFSYDMDYLPMGFSGLDLTASVTAHEILHLFGAPDWYTAGASGRQCYGVGSNFVNYMKENFPNDIMVRTYDHELKEPFYGEVNGEISEMTAYYVGLIDEAPSAVFDFNLDLSQHDPNRPRFVPDEE